jgi:anthranilate phosphoribosyltransferase
MQATLTQLIQHRSLTKNQAKDIILGIGEDAFSDHEIVGLMVSLQTRSLTLDEIQGFREALLELAITPDIDASNAIDLCGTGGDGKNTFNISTTTSFVLASMGYQVVKHGNYGVSSMCGSSNVLEYLGVKFSNDSEDLNKQKEEFNLCFLHAPLFHPVMKKVAPLRKSLGIPTFFNIMGPLVNPAQPAYQLTGTFSLELARIYHHVLSPHRKNYSVLHSMDGYDEISLTGDTRIFSKMNDAIVNANSVNIDAIHSNELHGGDSTEEAGQILKSILKGEGTSSQNHVVALNTAQGIITLNPEKKLAETFDLALEHIKSGEAHRHFESFINYHKTN